MEYKWPEPDMQIIKTKYENTSRIWKKSKNEKFLIGTKWQAVFYVWG